MNPLPKEYSKKVLIGNYAEERQTCPPGQNLYLEPPDTTDYSTWVREGRQVDLRTNKLQGEQGSMYTVLLGDAACRHNFLSTSDLVYRHQPRPLCGPAPRRYRRCQHMFVPQPDLARCLGNLTKWGLSEAKALEWRCADVSDHISSSYQDAYMWPQGSTKLDRFARSSLV